jgi:hypothetical protein
MDAIGVPVYCQGDLVLRSFRVDLDEIAPRLVPIDDGKSLPVTVSQDDPEQFVVMATTQNDVNWRVVVHLIADGERRTVIAPEAGALRTIDDRLFAVEQGASPE